MRKIIFDKDEAKGQVPRAEYADNFIAKDLISPSLCGAKNLRVGYVTVPPKSGGAIHKHDAEQAWYILRGEGYEYVDGEKHFFKAGVFMYVPANLAHQTVNTGEEPFEAIYIMSPGVDFSEIEVIEAFQKEHLSK